MRIKQGKWVFYHLFVTAFSIFMLYPVLWLVMSSFKPSDTIFLTADTLIPDPWIFDNYVQGWQGIGKQTFAVFIKNSLIIVVLSTIGAVLSSALVAFGFARLKFAGRGFWFAVMLLTLMLPYEVVMVPQYVLFAKLGWLNSFKPLIVPSYFGHTFFIFLMVQFIRTIPKELDERPSSTAATSSVCSIGSSCR